LLPLRLLVSLAGVLAPGLDAALAQEWPTHPVTMVIGTSPGGGSDIARRALADRLAEVLGQPVIVENIGTAVAAAARVAHAQANGYVFDFGFASTHALHPSLYKTPSSMTSPPSVSSSSNPSWWWRGAIFLPTGLPSLPHLPGSTRAGCNTPRRPAPDRSII